MMAMESIHIAPLASVKESFTIRRLSHHTTSTTTFAHCTELYLHTKCLIGFAKRLMVEMRNDLPLMDTSNNQDPRLHTAHHIKPLQRFRRISHQCLCMQRTIYAS